MDRFEFFCLPKGTPLKLSIPGEIEATGTVIEPTKRARLFQFDPGPHGQVFAIIDIDDPQICTHLLPFLTRL